MDFGAILLAIWEFIQAHGIHAILGLIALDVALGIAEALKKGVFEWGKVWQFMRTMILPHLIGYIALLAFLEWLPDGLLDGWIPEGLTSLMFTYITTTLLASIVQHLKYVFEGIFDWLRGANGKP